MALIPCSNPECHGFTFVKQVYGTRVKWPCSRACVQKRGPATHFAYRPPPLPFARSDPIGMNRCGIWSSLQTLDLAEVTCGNCLRLVTKDHWRYTEVSLARNLVS